jgi:hypothetical protein
MRNEYQEDRAHRDPLILVAPAANLVAILRLNWLDNIDRTAVSAKTTVGNYLVNRGANSEFERALFTPLGGSIIVR